MNTVLAIFGAVLAFTGLQASPVYEAIVPKSQQPFGPGDVTSNIIRGHEADVGQFPHQAAIVIGLRGFCGGSLISEEWILTAAHCVVKPMYQWSVSLGAHRMTEAEEPGRVTLVSRTGIAHEDFDFITGKGDIGVIKLPQAVTLGPNIKPIALPPRSFSERNFEGEHGRTSGWGIFSGKSHSLSPTLQYVDVTFISIEDCREYFGDIIDDKKICSSGEGGRGICSGDSGGPLTLTQPGKPYVHLGITSFGSSKGCGSGYPDGFTATAAFLDWIAENTGLKVPDA